MRGRAGVLAGALALAGCVAPGARPPLPPPAVIVAPAYEPPPARPLAALIADAPDLSRFRLLAGAGGLDALVAGRGPVAVLAPTDAAFARLVPGTAEALLLPGNRPSLRRLLRFWVVSGRDWTRALAASGGSTSVATLEGEALTLSLTPGDGTLRDVSGRGATIGVSPASDGGTLVTLDAIVAPRSIEPRRVGTTR